MPPAEYRVRLGSALLCVAAASLSALSGCGGSVATGAPSGAAVFMRECSACHSLGGPPSPQRQGGDLLGLRIRRAPLVQFVTEMPVAHRLTRAETRIVVDYVLSQERADQR